MAMASLRAFLILLAAFLSIALNPACCELSFGDYETFAFHGDYSPPSPPPPVSPPHPPSLTCEDGLGGVGSLDTTCELNSTLEFGSDVYIEGRGNLVILPNVMISCPVKGCYVFVNVSGYFRLGQYGTIIAGTVHVVAKNASFGDGSLVNVTALAGDPPAETSGTPSGTEGSGGGHGGRGASCLADRQKHPDDVWGGDAYSWNSLDEPFSYGSKGGTTDKEEDYGGKGGGRIRVEVAGEVEIFGSLHANGGDAGVKGGGGSGGSIFIKAQRMSGNGVLIAAGGNGFAGGGGGRISINVFSRHDDIAFFAHGGRSIGCPANSGAAGTYYDAVPRSLTIDNHNLSTDTDTLLLGFPKQPLWTNMYILNFAKACLPLYWGRVQVRGQLRMSGGALLSFGLLRYPSSEFELMSEELLMSDSVIKVYGALRMSVKMHLMLNSKILISSGSDSILATSSLESSNLVVLRGSSIIHSNANLGVHGQGYLNLTGPGDVIEAQRLVISLFYSISLGPGSVLRAPLESSSDSDLTPKLFCEREDCPIELIHPPEDCNLNSSLPFTLQICRVEDVIIEGAMTGSVVHFHWVRNMLVLSNGVISASGLGCTGGFGKGKMLDNGLGGGGGHGGKGGDGYHKGSFIDGGLSYGSAELPCELGSGSGNDNLAGATAGGGIIVMGSIEHSLSSLSIDGSLRADGESVRENIGSGRHISNVGPGGGSGGTILLFVHSVVLGNDSIISAVGGHGSPGGGGGGGGGRVHFHWSSIPTGNEYFPLATANGSIQTGGGFGRGQGRSGGNGTVTGKACPEGLYGIFCEECPVGTYKNISGSDLSLCHECPPQELPRRAKHIPVRGGVTENPCPYKCVSDRFHMPKCYTALEELIYTFGGPWAFGLTLLTALILLAVALSVARMKYVTGDEYDVPATVPARRSSRLDHSFPFLESLNEVMETNRIEESQTHVHRMYFMGPNTFSEPWHLTHSPPKQVTVIVFEDAFNRFVDEINALAAYQWWEGSVYLIFSLIAYPLAWSWLQQRRKKKLQQLRDFVRSEYDHACLRSCRSRALYEGLKVAATSDLMLGYVDFFLGGDEKRSDLPLLIHQRFPMTIMFGGDGSYMAPFCLHNDNILTSLMSQAVPPTVWFRMVAGLNAQLRLVHSGQLKVALGRISSWLETHANPTLGSYGIHIDLAWFQPTASGYRQFGLIMCATENQNHPALMDNHELSPPKQHGFCGTSREVLLEWEGAEDHLIAPKRSYGGILNAKSLRTLKEKSAICYPLSFLLYNTKPLGHQDLVGLVISILLLGDFSLVLLTLLQLYSSSLLDFLLVLFILPLAILFTFPAGISALFSHGPRRSAGLARVYALWNVTSLINVVVAFVCGYLHYKAHGGKKHWNFQSWNYSMDESEWWLLPAGLLLCKIIQTRFIDWHVANQEIQDHSLYSNDTEVFWHS